jgi:hypothetical protein
MLKIRLFVEDTGHQIFLNALLHRLIRQYKVSVDFKFESARGGHGTAITELKQYVYDLQRGRQELPDILIVAIDGNCKGYLFRKQQIDSAVKGFQGLVICAVPDPHIERWLLLDSAAFKKVLGVGCTVPTYKCERGLYKRLLEDAVAHAGEEPYLGGIEYTEAIVNVMDLDHLERTEASLGKLLKDLRSKFQEWQRTT